MGAFAAASIFLALFLGFVISWSFILPVREAEGFLGQIAKGDFSGTLDLLGMIRRWAPEDWEGGD